MATTKTVKKQTPEQAAKPEVKKKTTSAAQAKSTKQPKSAATEIPTPAVNSTASKKTVSYKSTPAEPKTASDSPKPVEAARHPQASELKAGKWGEIRQILLDMKQKTLLEIKRSIKSGSEASIGEEPTGDIYDQASSERDRELGLLLNDREREKLHNIDEALLRIEDGEYGQCEECDEEIPLGRLKVLPFTRHCVKCKSDLEKLQAQTRRIEEDRAYREIPVGDDDEA